MSGKQRNLLPRVQGSDECARASWLRVILCLWLLSSPASASHINSIIIISSSSSSSTSRASRSRSISARMLRISVSRCARRAFSRSCTWAHVTSYMGTCHIVTLVTRRRCKQRAITHNFSCCSRCACWRRQVSQDEVQGTAAAARCRAGLRMPHHTSHSTCDM